MKIVTSIEELQTELREVRETGKQIGYVPTMGYLHEGHQQLLKQARSANDIVVLSVFVNPLQFGENEDLDKYPRDIEHDEQVARQHDVDYIFYPSVEEMYPAQPSVTVRVNKRTNVLCGQSRPGHFDGVATVLTKLFNIIQPMRAYFGLKDAQQVAVVEGLVEDFNFPIQIVRVDTVREEDGLAKSSRNVFLTDQERKEAKHLYRSLQLGKALIAEGEKNPKHIITEMKKYIEQHTSGKTDYIEIYSYPDLEKIEIVEGQVIIALAVAFSGARLIDNVVFSI
ncbi:MULTISPECIES: pantoate--beta-alanine ligase [Bacillus]|uniref:pantoate--beta-alanine ligase n=1 Tax=Bacillus TaxID=1386 RepID=UPI0002DE132A|nr:MULTISPECIES: pantoate--beta-alanine ligase [Bacillus]